jgi:uncharacterized protein (DUF305 family)
MIVWHSICRVMPGMAVALGISSFASDHATAPRTSTARSTPAVEMAYVAENDAAMTRMMIGMAVKPTGDVDRDFVDMMVPHHQGAIDMAIAVLRFGRNEKIRRIAQEIIVDQQQEIAAMRLAVGEQLPPSIPSPSMPRVTSGN